jgi:hypothetical protein
VDHVGQTYRVDVKDSRGIGIVAQLGRIARDDQDVAQTQGVGTEQVRLHAEQVPVAATIVDYRFHADLPFDRHGQRHGCHARRSARPVGDVDRIDAGRGKLLGPAETL